MLTDVELDKMLAPLSPKMIAFDPALSKPHPANCIEISAEDARSMRRGPLLDFAATDADDPAYIVFTSGSGARPKPVMHAHRAVWARRMMWDGWYGLKSSDRMLHTGAFNWTYTMGTGLFDPWAKGATALIAVGEPNRESWARLAVLFEASLFASVPGIYRQILDSERGVAPFRDLRHGLSAGEALPEALRHRWEQETGTPLYEALGMSEISTFISSGPDTPVKSGRTGRPQPGRKVAVLGSAGPVGFGEEGLLAVHLSDPGLMLDYPGQPEEFEAAFRGEWFLTGDRALMDDDGYIAFLGREDDLLNTGGYRVSPQEVEAAITRFDGVEGCVVSEAEVKTNTKVLVAYYVSSTDLDLAELQAHVAKHLADYKRPRQYIQLENLPRSANGKIDRKSLRGQTLNG
jgi:acyl-coenzyme A synthetase/AMP-(fatty) acid ligase